MNRLLQQGHWEQQGMAMILALITLTLGTLLIVPVLSYAATGLKTTTIYERHARELYAADAGVESALWNLTEGGLAVPEGGQSQLPSLTLNNATVTVTIQSMGKPFYKITSIATSPDGHSTSIESYISLGSSPFDYAMASTEGDINLKGNAEITSSPDALEGNIYANGQITLKGNAEVQGDATATGAIGINGNASVTGDVEENGETLDFEPIDTSGFLSQANMGGTIAGDLTISGNGGYFLGPVHITGDLKISGNRVVTLCGTVWIDGTIKMSGNSRIEGGETIVAVGNIQIRGNSKLTANNMPFVISTTGDIKVTGNSWTSAILYAPNGDVELVGNAKVCGAVVGQNISGGGNSEVEYNTELKNHPDLPSSSSVRIRSWTIE